MRAFTRMSKARYVISLLVVCAVVFASMPVWASSEGGGHGGGGFNKKADLLYRFINFAVLLGALIFLLRKPMGKALDGRRQGIRDQLDDLERQKQEAQKKLAEYKGKLNLLQEEVEKIVADYVKEGEAAKEKIIAEAKGAAEKLQKQAKKNIEHEFQKARQELRAAVAEQAVAMAEELIKRNVTDEDHERIIDEYLKKVVVAQ